MYLHLYGFQHKFGNLYIERTVAFESIYVEILERNILFNFSSRRRIFLKRRSLRVSAFSDEAGFAELVSANMRPGEERIIEGGGRKEVSRAIY